MIDFSNNVLGERLLQAAINGNAEEIQKLIAEGADVDTRTEMKATALMQAASCGSVECVKVLIVAGSDLNLKDIFGETALTLASRHEYYDILSVLVDSGADIKCLKRNHPRAYNVAKATSERNRLRSKTNEPAVNDDGLGL